MSVYRNKSDKTLMEMIRYGDEEAFAELYHRYSHRMLRYFFRMLGKNEEKAQDFLQELFMKVVEKSHLYNSQHKFSTWLFSMAGNMCKNEYRSLEVRKIMTVTDELGHIRDQTLSIEHQLDHQQFECCLNEVLKQLGTSHQEVFVLRYQQELSIKEISEILNCAEGTVKSRIFYALRKLSDKLAVFRGLTNGK